MREGVFPIADILREALFAEPSTEHGGRGGQHDGCNVVDALYAIAEALNHVARSLDNLGEDNVRAGDAIAEALRELPYVRPEAEE